MDVYRRVYQGVSGLIAETQAARDEDPSRYLSGRDHRSAKD